MIHRQTYSDWYVSFALLYLFIYFELALLAQAGLEYMILPNDRIIGVCHCAQLNFVGFLLKLKRKSCVYVGTCVVCVCVWQGVNMHMYACMQKSDVSFQCLSSGMTTLGFETGSLIRVGCMAQNPEAPTCNPRAGVTSTYHSAQHFHLGSGDQT